MRTLANLSELITNTLSYDDACQPYSVMIGLSPSLGAKTPKLWNSLLAGSSKMICLDIPSKENLDLLFTELINDDLCLGGSVTAPYKSDVISLCTKRTSAAQLSFACNNFYRSGASGELIADNTDSKGFIDSLFSDVSRSEISSAIVIGAGGVGRAVVSGLLEGFDQKIPIYLLSRNSSSFTYPPSVMCMTCKSFLNGEYFVKCLSPLIVHCTSVGDYTNPEKDPLSEIKYLRGILSGLNVRYMFDCIHTPRPTVLSQLYAPNSQDGLRMNKIQAAIGFTNVYHSFDLSVVKDAFVLQP